MLKITFAKDEEIRLEEIRLEEISDYKRVVCVLNSNRIVGVIIRDNHKETFQIQWADGCKSPKESSTWKELMKGLQDGVEFYII